MKYLIILAALVLLSACAISRSQQTTPTAANDRPSNQPSPSTSNTSVVPNSPIRSVDFNNFTFDWYPAWADAPKTGKKIILKDGSMNLDFDYGKEPREFYFTEVRYGDLTGDGNEEAVVVVGVITSGTARRFLIFVYTMSSDKPKRLWAYESGDRSDYGYHDASIEDGQLLVERYKPIVVEYEGQTHQLPQSDTYVRDYYKWDGTSFRKIKTDELPLDPADSNPWVSKKK